MKGDTTAPERLPARRQGDVSRILTHVERTSRGGHGATVLIEGEAGIGKTTLLDDVTAAAAAMGVTVVRTSASILDRTLPFGPFLHAFGIDAASPMADSLQAPGDHEGATDHRRVAARVSPLQLVPAERVHVIEHIAAIVEMWSSDNPVLLALDDMHWADPETLLTIARLRRSSAMQSVTVIATSRSVADNRELHNLRAAIATGGGEVVVLGALDTAAVAQLLTDAVGCPPSESLLQIALRAGGNPFLTNELVSALQREGRIVVVAGVAGVDASTVPVLAEVSGFRDTVLARMADVGSECSQLLQVGALLGSSFSLSEVAAILGRPVAALLVLTSTATSAGLLQEQGRHLSFRHDLVREAIESTIGSGSLAALHLDIARCLATSDATAVRVATHYALGAEVGDHVAVEWLRKAAAQIVGRAPSSAAELFERALALTRLGDPQRDTIIAEVVDAAFWGGQIEHAADLARTALSRPLPPAVEATLHESIARSLVVLGRPAEAVRHAERLVELSEHRAWPLALSAVFKLFALDLDGAVGDARRSIELCAQQDDPWAETLAYCVASWEENARGFDRPAVELADAAVRAADRSANGEAHRLVPHLYRGLALESAGRTEDAQATLAHGQQLAEQLGIVWATPFYHYALALTPWNAGRWDVVQAEIDAGLRYAREHDIGLVASFACGLGATALLYRGDLAGATALLDEGDERLARGGVQYGVDWLLRGRALLFEAQGDATSALATLRLGWDVADGLKAEAILAILGPDLVRIALDLGDELTAQMATDGLVRDVVDDTRMNIDGHALRCQGLVGLDIDLLFDARRLHTACERPVEVVQDDEALAVVLARLGRLGEAAARRDICFEGCEALGITLIAERLRRTLSTYDAKQAKRPVLRALTGWGALTATERLVATRVAAGKTNPQVAAEMLISRRTVESHLYRVYFKLDVANRTELAVVAMTHATTSPTS